ncbi:winged helix-turn-helix transcriptional regulator [Kitasatospora aureofaciens]|uniref:winged helix-turn-helix transcriptional regulator n=1 Tax=Kitasatospora aureofaciens TaxID=1894 RepID=UPI0027E097B5|nr:winged helix-turn-helix transcriptional regulator [Kitasatospora aureofaciens]
MLVLRELMYGPAAYGELRGRLPGISTQALAERLRALGGGSWWRASACVGFRYGRRSG